MQNTSSFYQLEDKFHTLAVKLFHYVSQLCSISSSQLTGPLSTLKEVEGWLQHEHMKWNR